MGMLNRPDAVIYRKYFKEMSKLIGIPVKYRYPIYEDPTIHAEIKCEYSEEIPMDIIFETNPKVATLRAIGYVSEFKDDKPLLAMIPYDAPHIQTKCTIELEPIYSVGDRGRLFEITSINTLFEYPDCYICSVAPIMDNDNELSEIKNDYSDSNYNHINYDKLPTVYDDEKYKETLKEVTNDETSYFKW